MRQIIDFISNNRRWFIIGAGILVAFIVMLVIWPDNKSSFESFVVEQGKGLSYYLGDDKEAINIAEQFGLLIYKGQGWNKKNRISYEEARKLVKKTDEIQITVKLRPGWVFANTKEGLKIYLPEEDCFYTAEEFCRNYNKTHYREFYQ